MQNWQCKLQNLVAFFESACRTASVRWMEGEGKGWMKGFSALSFVTLYFFWQWPVWKNFNYCHAALFITRCKMHLLQREGPFCSPLVNFDRLCFHWWGGQIDGWKGKTAEMEGRFWVTGRKIALFFHSFQLQMTHVKSSEREEPTSLARYCFVHLT